MLAFRQIARRSQAVAQNSLRSPTSLANSQRLAVRSAHNTSKHPDVTKGTFSKISGPGALIVGLTAVGVATAWMREMKEREGDSPKSSLNTSPRRVVNAAKSKAVAAADKVAENVEETVTEPVVPDFVEVIKDDKELLPAKADRVIEEVKSKGTLALTPLPEDTTVIFVLGGPGAGKGTQCANLVRDYNFVHLSAGDLLRAEQNRAGSKYGELIKSYIKEGQIVPMEITIALLHAAMKDASSNRFLVDGFPRKMDQALKFEEEVCEGKFVLYFECPEEEMLKRLLKRGETSGRVDDNIESIKKRFQTFKDTSYPVIEHYQQKGKVKTVSCMKSVDDVYKDTRQIVDELLR